MRMKVLPFAFNEGTQLLQGQHSLLSQLFLSFSRDVPVRDHRQVAGQFIELISDVLE
jgi:hypothetical protein